MVNETADFPARAAAAFFSRIGRPVKMRGGTDDINTFYRRIPTAMPQWCVVAVLNPQSGEVEYYTLPSFKFGLASAPNQCNRASEVGMQSARALGVCCCKFFDDFNVSGQWVLRVIMALWRRSVPHRAHAGAAGQGRAAAPDAFFSTVPHQCSRSTDGRRRRATAAAPRTASTGRASH